MKNNIYMKYIEIYDRNDKHAYVFQNKENGRAKIGITKWLARKMRLNEIINK